ncbi:hypothetical protein BDW02DRAFT_573892 [Decorospora gaudefroyi]|uniref:Uncharacterized protein n=1 Tax=Decorospora gaudefroyi TaxID=184978 RepID=A0A6A5JYT1_9PLEO|nr:hypothetical protein BDW02DRAFT_573892 [Decorospora gaudefroyi]
MTPRTRSSNQRTNFKVYYSKKVPQQIHFPHKSKTVRRPSTPPHDGLGKRQMVFLPEKMKLQRNATVEDSDMEDEDTDMEEDMEQGGVAIGPQADEGEEQRTANKIKGKGKKRSSDVMQGDDSEDDELVRCAPKRRRKAESPKPNRRSRRTKPESDHERDIDRAHTLRRQSTMTQLVDGRKPLPGVEEPDFRPVKRSSRLSWGGKGKSDKARRDRKQRTLTQMVPGMRPLGIMSDEDVEELLSDVEAQERDSQIYGEAVAQRLARQGLHRGQENISEDVDVTAESGEGIQTAMEVRDDGDDELPIPSQNLPTLVVQSVEDEMHEDCEDSYRPTQYIDAPVTRASRTGRRRTAAQATESRPAEVVPARPSRASKSRFSLLATPEKRRIREIPSSQSPADSPLSTQNTPQKSHRSPLKERSENGINAPETPSRRKQVTFEVTGQTPVPPPTLSKFQSTIQDSEDEDDIIKEDIVSTGGNIGAHTQALINNLESTAPSKTVGADTQALIDQIDQTCVDAIEDDEVAHEEASQDSVALADLRCHNEPSPELGEPHKHSNGQRERAAPEEQSNHVADARPEELPYEEDDADATIPPVTRSYPSLDERPNASETTTSIEGQLPESEEQGFSTTPPAEPYIQETLPSTPMVIQDDSSDEEDLPGPEPIPPRSSRPARPQPPSTNIQQSTDLDGQPIQVPRSPSPEHETQQSHWSKAEQQLQNEWFSYSQYVHARPPQSSSMRAAPDSFSYKATPHPARNPSAPQPQHPPSGSHPSQATTVDEITQRTPRRNRTQPFSSTHTTPHRIASSQPVISPSKPPPLFIPSSFPSPAKAAMDAWSSPVLGPTEPRSTLSQWASFEDFSIPGPPPVEWDE